MKNEKVKTGVTLPKMIILGVVIAVLAVGGGVLGSYLSSDEAKALIVSAKEEEKEQIIVPYSEFLINLKPVSQNDKSFLRIEFTFEVANADNETLLLSQEARVRDTIISLLRKKTAETVFVETEGNLIIKQEVKDQLNQMLGGSIIEQVYVTDIVMQ